MNLTPPKYKDGIKTVVQSAFGGIDRREGASDGAISHMLNMTGDHYPVLSTRGGRAPYDDYTSIVDKYGVSDYERSEMKLTLVCDVSDVPYYVFLGYDDGIEQYFLVVSMVDADGIIKSARLLSCEDYSALDNVRAVAFNNRLVVFAHNQLWRVWYAGKAEQLDCEQYDCELPSLEHICVNRDRIWGTTGNEIYCCASCEPGVWFRYDNTAADSFYAQIPEVSRFTGVASYGGSVYFFTSENVYRMYGTTPDAFSLVPLGTYGMDESESESFGTAAQMLFYNSVCGPACFDGDSAKLIGHPLGSGLPTAAVGIGCAQKYYMADGADLYVFDASKGIWQVHGVTDDIVDIGVFGGRAILFTSQYAEYVDKKQHEPVSDEDCTRKSQVEFADITEGALYGVMPIEFVLGAWLGEGASLSLSICCDTGDWTQIWSTTECGKHVHRVRFSPKSRCDHYRLRLDGVGDWKLYSLARSYSVCASTPYGE